MSDTKFTPGPWRAEHGCIMGKTVGGSQMRDDWFRLADARGWGWLSYRGDAEEVQNANAHLIAESPNLYAALEKALPILRDHLELYEGHRPSIIEEVENALAHARGEQAEARPEGEVTS